MGSAAALRPRLIVGGTWRELSHVPGLLRGLGSSAPPPGEANEPDVLLLPGMFSGDASLAAMASALEAAGHAPGFTGIRMNVDCSEAALRRLEGHVQRTVRARGAPLTLVGHSRGGLFARALAVRRPDLVEGLVTLGSPHRDQLAIHPAVWASAWGLAALGRLGVRGVMRAGCGSGRCCDRFRHDLAAPLNDETRFVSIYSRVDGVVDWRACLDPAARLVEVSTPHLAFTTAPEAITAVCAALAHRRAAPAPPRELRRQRDVRLPIAA